MAEIDFNNIELCVFSPENPNECNTNILQNENKVTALANNVLTKTENNPSSTPPNQSPHRIKGIKLNDFLVIAPPQTSTQQESKDWTKIQLGSETVEEQYNRLKPQHEKAMKLYEDRNYKDAYAEFKNIYDATKRHIPVTGTSIINTFVAPNGIDIPKALDTVILMQGTLVHLVRSQLMMLPAFDTKIEETLIKHLTDLLNLSKNFINLVTETTENLNKHKLLSKNFIEFAQKTANLELKTSSSTNEQFVKKQNALKKILEPIVQELETETKKGSQIPVFGAIADFFGYGQGRGNSDTGTNNNHDANPPTTTTSAQIHVENAKLYSISKESGDQRQAGTVAFKVMENAKTDKEVKHWGYLSLFHLSKVVENDLNDASSLTMLAQAYKKYDAPSVCAFYASEAVKRTSGSDQSKMKNLLKTLSDEADAALKKNTKNTEALLTKAFLLNHEGKYFDALRYSKQVLLKNDKHMIALAAAGIAYNGMGRKTDAKTIAAKMAKNQHEVLVHPVFKKLAKTWG